MEIRMKAKTSLGCIGVCRVGSHMSDLLEYSFGQDAKLLLCIEPVITPTQRQGVSITFLACPVMALVLSSA